jgi:hypothetical protein
MLLKILSFCSSIILRRQRIKAFYAQLETPTATVRLSPEDFRLWNNLSVIMHPNRTSSQLPYKSHPIYQLRRITIWIVLIGLFLQLFAIPAQSWTEQELTWVAILLAASLAYIIYDLVTWAHEKAGVNPLCQQNTSHKSVEVNEPSEHSWPRPLLLVADALLALVLQWIFWYAVVVISNGSSDHYNNGPELLQAYACLPAFFASILHAVAFWKELMARKKAEWLRELPPKPCTQCGFVSINDAPQEHVHDAASQEQTRDTLPRWAQAFNNKSRNSQSDVENGLAGSSDGGEQNLLITPSISDECTIKGYGTLSQSVQSLNGECEEVIKKKKKNKRIIGEEWTGEGNSRKNKGKGKYIDKGSGIEEMGA